MCGFTPSFTTKLGVYNEDEHGNPVYNFAYVDQIYDGLLKNGVRPYVEISFMPQEAGVQSRCAASLLVQAERFASQEHGPVGRLDAASSRNTWSIAMASTKCRSGTSRYGTSRTSISGMGFRAKNAISTSTPIQHAHLKRVNPRLRVGGPATAAAAWVGGLPQVSRRRTMFRSISSPLTAMRTTPSRISLARMSRFPMDERVCRAVEKGTR